MSVILGLTICLIVYGLVEYRRHLSNLSSVPIRIHVNGTRGKSSVTRLIAAGLRAGGLCAVAKTTGSSPRLIGPQGGESHIRRAGTPNIREQVWAVSMAAREGAQVLVAECMAVRPKFQWISEHRMLRSTIGVITNVRPDHLDEMGPTLKDVADALSGTIPRRGDLFTGEETFLTIFRQEAERLGTKVHLVTADAVDREQMKGFDYVEHRANVALALSVCEFLGIDRGTALAAMYLATPDPGVLRQFLVEVQGKEIKFINAFAANDPESIGLIWRELNLTSSSENPIIVILTLRGDRLQRGEQLASFVSTELTSDYLLLAGDNTKMIEANIAKRGMRRGTLLSGGSSSSDEIFDRVVAITPGRSTVIGIGNIVGLGNQIVARFEKGRCDGR